MESEIARPKEGANGLTKKIESTFAAPPKVQVTQDLRGAELTARARLEQLFDTGTFTEIDAGVHHRARQFGMDTKTIPGDGVVCGFGEIDGRTVYAYSQDRTVLGGSLGEAHGLKIAKITELAGKALIGEMIKRVFEHPLEMRKRVCSQANYPMRFRVMLEVVFDQ